MTIANASQNFGNDRISKRRILVFSLEIILVLALLVLWLSSEKLQQSRNLWVLFFYSIPCQFLIAIVPHEPVFLYFSKFYQPLTVTLVSVSGAILTEILNYSTFGFIVDLSNFDRLKHSGIVARIIGFFHRAPFLVLWIAGFTPIPFYPFRFLVVLAKYPLGKYLLSVALSRTPRFFLLALLGYAFKLPDWALAALFVSMILLMNIPIVLKQIQRYRKKKYAP
ncbi:MAG: hypothetical protein SCK70_03525 [bacterium]|nr:hypothetical protein [bacterium]